MPGLEFTAPEVFLGKYDRKVDLYYLIFNHLSAPICNYYYL